MRIIELTARFHRLRLVHAPLGSLQDIAVRRALRRLASDSSPLPLPGDEIDLPTPYVTIWAHHLRPVRLVITYTFTLPVIQVHTIRPDLHAG